MPLAVTTMIIAILFFLLIHSNVFQTVNAQKYNASWESLDTRPTPSWFDDVKIGIFLHWGVYSVPSFGGSAEWFWADWNSSQMYQDFMQKNYPPNFTYQDFGKDFTAEFFNPDDWAELFKKSGAEYVVLTSKHHEGFTLWPSQHSFGWNAKDIGPKRDLVGDLAKSVRNQNLKFGVYYSLYEWYNPIYLSDKNNLFMTQEFVDNKMLPEMYDLVNTYEPSIFWVDGDWEANDTYFRSTEFLAWLYNESPVKTEVLVNDRWGIGIPCEHGDFYSCQDRFNPGTLQTHKWENAMTVDKESWGYRRNANISSYLTTHEMLTTLAQTISCGGNILIDVGPTKEGTIAPIFQERLLDLGIWLSVNGEAIYYSKPWTVQNDTLTPGVWYTTSNDRKIIYAITLYWPDNNVLQLESVSSLLLNELTTVNLLGNSEYLQFNVKDSVAFINFTDKAKVKSEWVWVLKIDTNAATNE